MISFIRGTPGDVNSQNKCFNLNKKIGGFTPTDGDR